MTKKIRNTKVRRTLAAVMSSIMIISAGMAVSATAVNAASLAPVTASASSTESWREKLSRSDSSVKTCVQSVKTLIDILAKKLPGGDYFKIFTSFMLSSAIPSSLENSVCSSGFILLSSVF